MKKKLTMILTALFLCIGTAWAQFALEPGKMYALKESTSELYLDIQTLGIKDGNRNTNNISLNDKPCIIFFENGSTTGTWKIKNANGQYVYHVTGDGHWNPEIATSSSDWTVSAINNGGYTLAREDGKFINVNTKASGEPLYCDKGTGMEFVIMDYPKDIQTYYTLKSPTGTYLNFTKVGTTAISFQETPSYLYMIPTANGYVFEDKDNAGQYIGLSTSNNWDAGTGLAVWNVSEADEDGYVTISRFDNSFNLGHDKNATAGTGIYTNVGDNCFKWLIEKIDKYAGTVPTFTDETSTINSYGQYLTALKLDETTVLSGLSAPASTTDMYVVAEDAGIVLEPGSEHVFSLTFPKNQTSQILAANLWIDKDGDGTYETHLGTTGNANSNNNDISSVTFAIPEDATPCLTRIRLRLDSSWGIAETANANANRMVYDIPISIVQRQNKDYTFELDNTTGQEVVVTYNGHDINSGDTIERFDASKLDATDVPGYEWSVEIDDANNRFIIRYTRTHYDLHIETPEGETVDVTYDGTNVEENALIEISSFNADLFSASEISGYTWSIVVDEENYTVTLTYTEAPVVENPAAVVALVGRIGGADVADRFKFVLDPSLNSKQEVFVLGSEEGKILVKGTTISAITTGLGWYLNHIAHINISWNSLNEKTVAVKNEGVAYADLSNLPLPTVEETHVSDAKYRYYLNTCAFGYSMTSWTWTRWQQEIDWMALHGINMPLQLVGLEEVWRTFLTMEKADGARKYGYTDEEAKAFVAGPAFIAWWAMNNLEGWGGTAAGTKSGGTWEGAGGVQDDAWYARQKKLAKQIVDRQRALGMQPVLPGWSGMVPTNFASKSGYATRGNGGNWAGDFVRPLLLNTNIGADKYAEIAADYYKCLDEVMGESQYYSMDPFHEGGGAGTMEDYEALYAAMEAAKAGSQWVIQQWQWSPTQKYSLTAVPAGRLIVLDLFSDGSPAFDGYNGYAPQDAVFCAIPNFGGRSGLMGRLQNVTDNYFSYKAKYTSIKGIGTAPEAIEQTPVTYDLIFQLPWMNGVKPDVAKWVDNYSIARYGKDNVVVKEAWSLLRQGPLAYGADGIQGPVEDVWAARPNLNASPASAWGKTLNHAGGIYTKARRQMLIDAVYKLLSQQEALGMAAGSVYESNYMYDLVEFGGGVMADYAYDLLLGIRDAKNAGNTALYESRRDAFLQLILDVDAFKGTNLNFRLGKWTQEARDAAAEVEGATTATPDWYEYNNARTIVSTWSSPNTNLNDYSYRSWQGLMKDLYYPRWKHYFDNNCTGAQYGYFEWNWAHGKEHYVGQTAVSDVALTAGQAGHTDSYTREPEGNTVEQAVEMLRKYIIPVAMADGTHYAYRYLTNDLSNKVTIIAMGGGTIDLTKYFGALEGATVTGDFIDGGSTTDFANIAVKSELTEEAYTGTITLADGTVLTFGVSANPKYYGAYQIRFDASPVFIQYSVGGDNSGSVGYKVMAAAGFDENGNKVQTGLTADYEADKIFTIVPSGIGYSLSAQGQYLMTTASSGWAHIMFSEEKGDAGTYTFTEDGDLVKLKSTNNTGKASVSIFGNGAWGNDVDSKAKGFTIEEVTTFPLTITSAGMATLCLPFHVVLPEGMEAYDLVESKINKTEAYMDVIAEAGDVLLKGTPVIVKANEGSYDLTITMDGNGAKTSLPNSLLRGNFVKQDLTQEENVDVKKFIFAKPENKEVGFYIMSEGTSTIGPNKCWMEWQMPADANVRALVIRFGNPTDIEDVVAPQKPAAQVIYNLAGQRLAEPQKGINIINGRKVIR